MKHMRPLGRVGLGLELMRSKANDRQTKRVKHGSGFASNAISHSRHGKRRKPSLLRLALYKANAQEKSFLKASNKF